MTRTFYTAPVDRLLRAGDPRGEREWSDYPKTYGLTAEHVPELVRMATDRKLFWANENSADVWAPIHAWRALGQLHAAEAVEPLLQFMSAEDDPEWMAEELPSVFALIGPAAIPALTAYLADRVLDIDPRITAASALRDIAAAHPEARAGVIDVLTRQLDRYTEDDQTVNGFLVSDLIDLQAVEAAPLIERAFAAGKVDLLVCGDWSDVQVELGLKTRVVFPHRGRDPRDLLNHPIFSSGLGTAPAPSGQPSNAQSSGHKGKKHKKRK